MFKENTHTARSQRCRLMSEDFFYRKTQRGQVLFRQEPPGVAATHTAEKEREKKERIVLLLIIEHDK